MDHSIPVPKPPRFRTSPTELATVGIGLLVLGGLNVIGYLLTSLLGGVASSETLALTIAVAETSAPLIGLVFLVAAALRARGFSLQRAMAWSLAVLVLLVAVNAAFLFA